MTPTNLAADGQPAPGMPCASEETIDTMVTLRRAIHRHPEVGLATRNTQGLIVEALEAIGLSPVLTETLDGVFAWIAPEKKGITTVLRADMDALPIQEQTNLAFSSANPGVMHACGHDLHVASLVGAAQLIVEKQHELPGPVLLVFQPGEEGHHGARSMLSEGVLDGLDGANARALALHVWTRHSTGTFHVRSGPVMASNDNFAITVQGRGGHASAPHLALDPITVAAQLVISLQSAVSREVPAADPAVLTVCQFNAGTAENVIPDTARVFATCRTLSPERRAAMLELVDRVARGVTAAHGATAMVDHAPVVPVTVNDPVATTQFWHVATRIGGVDSVREMPNAEMGAEDFAYFLERVPGCFAWVGARPPESSANGYPDIHSDRVIFDEDAMPIAAAVYAGFALQSPLDGQANDAVRRRS